MGNHGDSTGSRRRFLVRSVGTVATLGGLAGCTTSNGSSTPTATPTRTCPNPSPESGKLKFVHCTDRAVCSLELEDRQGNTIEILDLPNTHDKLKPYNVFTYASDDYPQIDQNTNYDITATTCEGNDSRTTTDFNFGRGGVYRIHSW